MICTGRYDRKVLELYGANASVNFPHTGMVDPAAMRVQRLRTGGGQELSGVMSSVGVDKMKVKVVRAMRPCVYWNVLDATIGRGGRSHTGVRSITRHAYSSYLLYSVHNAGHVFGCRRLAQWTYTDERVVIDLCGCG